MYNLLIIKLKIYYVLNSISTRDLPSWFGRRAVEGIHHSLSFLFFSFFPFKRFEQVELLPQKEHRNPILGNLPYYSGNRCSKVKNYKLEQFEIGLVVLSLDLKMVIQRSNFTLGGSTRIFLVIPIRPQTSLNVCFGWFEDNAWWKKSKSRQNSW